MNEGELRCKNCLEPFRPKNRRQIFCDSVCRNTYWVQRHPRVRMEAAALLKSILAANIKI